MKIDNDIRLFLPNEYDYILYGGNFLFSKRFYEIAKRTLSIKRIDFTGKLDEISSIEALIKYYKAKHFIFTSELLNNLSKEDYESFYSLILNNRDIKFIFVNILEPLDRVDYTTDQHEVVSFVENFLDKGKDLIYYFDSFLTYVHSNIQKNILYKLKGTENHKSIYLADDLINELIPNLQASGKYFASPSKRTYKEVYNYVIHQSKSALNLIYRKKPYEIVGSKSVAEWRMLLGTCLAEQLDPKVKDDIDIIVPVPETGKTYAQGVASCLNKPYVEALYKKAELGRSFDIENIEVRKQFIKNKLGLISSLVKGKVVGIVDEAIFTGLTLKEVTELLKAAEVKKVYLLIPSSECSNSCTYNMQPTREFLSEKYNVSELNNYFGVEQIFFQDRKLFRTIMNNSGFNYLCCFNYE